jgi:hypothetical protein
MTTFSLFSLFAVLNLLTLALAAPLDRVTSRYGSCERLLERKEWYVVAVTVICRDPGLIQESAERCREEGLHRRGQVFAITACPE